jgi:hypothetical protein
MNLMKKLLLISGVVFSLALQGFAANDAAEDKNAQCPIEAKKCEKSAAKCSSEAKKCSSDAKKCCSNGKGACCKNKMTVVYSIKGASVRSTCVSVR